MAGMKEEIVDFLKEFSKTYFASLGSVMIKRMTEGGNPEDERKLKYREGPLPRSQLFDGVCYFKRGNGPGSFDKWKKVRVKETKDYKLEVYKFTEDGKDPGKKPLATIQCAGYDVIDGVRDHYMGVINELGDSIGISDEQKSQLVDFSIHSWSLYNQFRENYIFQLHQQNETSKGCCGAMSSVMPEQDDDLGKEEAAQRPTYLTTFERCIHRNVAFDPSSPASMAFTLTVEKMCQSNPDLYDFHGNGTEPQILSGMILHTIFPKAQEQLLEKLKGPASLRISLYYKLRGQIQSVVEKLVEPAWSGMQKGSDTVVKKAEEKLQVIAVKIKEVRANIRLKIKEKAGDKVANILAKFVQPVLQPVVGLLAKPYMTAMEKNRVILARELKNIKGLPEDEAERNSQLNDLFDKPEVAEEVEALTANMFQVIVKIKTVLENLPGDFQGPDLTVKYRNAVEESIAVLFDAVIFTLQGEITEKGRLDELLPKILEDYDHDVYLRRRTFIRDCLRDAIMTAFKRASKEIIGETLGELTDALPGDLADIVDMRSLLEGAMEAMVEEQIAKSLDKLRNPAAVTIENEPTTEE